MKILCDVCDKDEASFFCVADEASLCAACDHRVHHANKLAGKHQRFSLHHPSPKQAPLCDICQERRAFLFCQQDRAILCKDCDIPIHKANEHTQKHTRFLLTGVKLSATSTLYSASSSSPPPPPPSSAESDISSSLTNNASDAAAAAAASSIKHQDSKLKPAVSTAPTTHRIPPPVKGATAQSTTTVAAAAPESYEKSNAQLLNGGNTSNGAISTSSISEYLMEMLPGWHVEDFLDSPSPSPSGFCQKGEKDMLLPFWDADLQSNMSVFPTENMGFWVPQVQQIQNQTCESIDLGFGLPNGYRDQQSKDQLINTNSNINIKSSRKRSEDNSFAVPQISPSSTASKRSRSFW